VNLEIEECKKDEDWDNFLIESNYKTIFAFSDYISSDYKKIKKFFCKQGRFIKAGFILNISNKDIILNENLIYTPIIYRSYQNTSVSRINREKFFINKHICNFIVNNFNKIEIVFDHNTNDIRPFIWYDFPEYKKQFIIQIKYTLLLNLKTLDNNEFEKTTLFKNFSETNRKEYRRSKKLNYSIHENFSKNIFLELTMQTFEKQNMAYDKILYESIFNNLYSLYKKNLIKMYILKNKINEVCNFLICSEIRSDSIFLFFGKNYKIADSEYSSVYFYCELFKILNKKNITNVDLEGMNSPLRSFNKLGFGGKLKPYYFLKRF